MKKGNEPLDRAYFERKKNPKYDDGEKLTKCCNQSKYHETLMYGNEEDWRLIEEYIEAKLHDYSNTISITPVFCVECDRLIQYKAAIDTSKVWSSIEENN